MVYQHVPDKNASICEKLKELATIYPRHGHQQLFDKVSVGGIRLNHKRSDIIYQQEGLNLSKKRKKKKGQGLREARPVSENAHEVWS